MIKFMIKKFTDLELKLQIFRVKRARPENIRHSELNMMEQELQERVAAGKTESGLSRGEFLDTFCCKVTDKESENRPCDWGTICDKCRSKDLVELWEELKTKEVK